MGIERATDVNQLWIICFYIVIISLQHCTATDTLTKDSPVYIGKTLVSANQLFELGFFSPGDNSTKRYLGIWFKNATAMKIIWVANREAPLSVSDTNSSLNIASDGNLRILDGDHNTVWSTNIRLQFNETAAKLTDAGDFCLNDTISGSILWESFDYPGNSLLPGMKLGTNGKHLLTSWKSDEDPTPGKFVVGLSKEQPPQIFSWDGSKPHWRGGPWNGGKFIGIPEQLFGYSEHISLVPENSQEGPYLTMTINLLDWSQFQWLYLQPDGVYHMIYWDDFENEWYSGWDAPANRCDIYGVCGAFAICTNNTVSMCECLRGFEPLSNDEWSKSNWTKGCVRKSELLCEKNETSLAFGKTESDIFQVLSNVKLPDHYHYFPNMGPEECKTWCLRNCSCKAYAFVIGIYCMAWTEDLIDIEQFSVEGENLFLRLSYAESVEETNVAEAAPAPTPAPTPEAATIGTATIVIIIFASICGVLLLAGFIFCLYRWKTYKNERINNLDYFNTEDELVSRDTVQEVLTQDSYELPTYEFKQIIAATDNFSYINKLGEGGFGPVYKGMLDSGQHIAVKRLSVESGQGIEEFKNEIVLISKLQHRNLVKLLGCCIEGKERLLIYEYMTNKSLDTFLFDRKKRLQLDWATRFNIIQGIGLARTFQMTQKRANPKSDLKCSNILLDEKLNPKISDFGLARTFQMTQELANTQRIVGTYGYMSPEYAMGGVISEKSDVFSYGVMLLEIMSGKRNTEFIHQAQTYPLGHAWELWKEGRGKEFMDQSILGESSCLSEGLRCIHVGLLCVQDLAKDRPTMTEAVYMLSTESDLPEPKEPLFTLQRLSGNSIGQESNNLCSINEVTVSMVDGR